jgi:hypothetical protein
MTSITANKILAEKRALKYLFVYGNIILKWILSKLSVRVHWRAVVESFWFIKDGVFFLGLI